MHENSQSVKELHGEMQASIKDVEAKLETILRKLDATTYASRVASLELGPDDAAQQVEMLGLARPEPEPEPEPEP